jgi:hypothetical protein
MSQKVLLTSKEVNIILHRLACQLIENHLDFSNSVLIGIQPRGVSLAERLKIILETEYNIKNISLGFLDITFFRDDFRRGEKQLEAHETQIDFLIEDKTIIKRQKEKNILDPSCMIKKIINSDLHGKRLFIHAILKFNKKQFFIAAKTNYQNR